VSWWMFLDDEREPGEFFQVEGERVMIARTYWTALEYMRIYGCPEFISFDHDLGHKYTLHGIPLTGLDVVKWMIEQDLDEDGTFIPKDFKFSVHSMNPVGGPNIKALLDAYFRAKNISPE
jgi:hypothetical protein